jgi:hypothetical protein
VRWPISPALQRSPEVQRVSLSGFLSWSGFLRRISEAEGCLLAYPPKDLVSSQQRSLHWKPC